MDFVCGLLVLLLVLSITAMVCNGDDGVVCKCCLDWVAVGDVVVVVNFFLCCLDFLCCCFFNCERCIL